MPINKRSFNISNLNRDNNLLINNNAIEVIFPDGIFSAKIDSIALKHMYIDYEYETLGSSNNQFIIVFPENAIPVTITINTDKELVQTDDQLAQLIANTINSSLGTNIFQVYHNTVSRSENDIINDSYNRISNYTIYTINNQNFDLYFDLMTSIGPLIGFGTSIYTGSYNYIGGNTPSISFYETIHVVNNGFNTNKSYNNSKDYACKMNLYDSNDNLILNYLDNRDTTISLPLADNYIYSISSFINYIMIEMNRYKGNFLPEAQFVITFDYEQYKFTIINLTGAKFGIGFRFYNEIIDNSNNKTITNNYGGLHHQLGFEKKNYLGITSINSIKPATIFGNSFYNDYILLCSDLVLDNYDVQFTMLGSQTAYSFYDALFIIPAKSIINNEFIPTFKEDYITNIASSLFAKLYNENKSTAKTAVFYLKSTTGRHIKITTEWCCNIDIVY